MSTSGAAWPRIMSRTHPPTSSARPPASATARQIHAWASARAWSWNRRFMPADDRCATPCVQIFFVTTARVEEFSKQRKMPRSPLSPVAVDQYVQHHRADDVTRRLNEIYAREDSTLDPLLERLQSHALPREEW